MTRDIKRETCHNDESVYQNLKILHTYLILKVGVSEHMKHLLTEVNRNRQMNNYN